MAGDFNLILDPTDKNNARINRRNMNRFRRLVDSLELRDIHLHGRTYTWSNEHTNPTLVRLGRILTSVDWEELYPLCFLQALSSDDSDHCPLLLLTKTNIRSKPRFHFETFWPNLEGFLDAVSRGWICSDAVTNPFRRLDCKLRNVANEL